jgi:hypothetical protein
MVDVLLMHVKWLGQWFWSWEMQMFLADDVGAVLHILPNFERAPSWSQEDPGESFALTRVSVPMMAASMDVVSLLGGIIADFPH